MFCTTCGTNAAEAANFCGQCGNAVTGPALPLSRAKTTLQAEEKEISQVRPWIRYWARMLDVYVVCLVGSVIFTLLAPQSFLMFNTESDYWPFGLASLAAWVFIEAAFLSAVGWTPGKWLLQIRLAKVDGTLPSYNEALSRSCRVWWRGIAAGFPLVGAATMLHARKQLMEWQTTSWDRDGDFRIEHGAIGFWRCAAAVAFFFVVFAVATAGNDAAARVRAAQEEAIPALTNGPNVFDQFDSAPSGGKQTAAAIVDPFKQAVPRDKYSTPPAPPQPAPIIDQQLEDAHWNSDANAFEAAHPAVSFGGNAKLIQAQLETLNQPGKLTNRQLIDAAYAAATADPRWASTP